MNTRNSVIAQILSGIAFGSCVFTLMAGTPPPETSIVVPPDKKELLVPSRGSKKIANLPPSRASKDGGEILLVVPALPTASAQKDVIETEDTDNVVVGSEPVPVLKLQGDMPAQILFPNQSHFKLITSWPRTGPVVIQVYPWDESLGRFTTVPLDDDVLPDLEVKGGDSHGLIEENIDVTILREKRSEWLFRIRLLNSDPSEKVYTSQFHLVLPNKDKNSDIKLVSINYPLDDVDKAEELGKRKDAEFKLQQESYKKVMDAWAENPPVAQGAVSESEKKKIVFAVVDSATPHLNVQLPRDVIYISKEQLKILEKDAITFLKGVDEADTDTFGDIAAEKKAKVFREASGVLVMIEVFAFKDYGFPAIPKFQLKRNKLTEDKGIKDLFVEPDAMEVDLGTATVGRGSLASLHVIPGANFADGSNRTKFLQVFPDHAGKVNPRLNLSSVLSEGDDYFRMMWLDGPGSLGQSHALILSPEILKRPLAVIDGQIPAARARRSTRQADTGHSSSAAFMGELASRLKGEEVIVIVGGSTGSVERILRLFKDRVVLRIAEKDKELMRQFKDVIPRFTGGLEVLTLSNKTRLKKDLNIPAENIVFMGDKDNSKPESEAPKQRLERKAARKHIQIEPSDSGSDEGVNVD